MNPKSFTTAASVAHSVAKHELGSFSGAADLNLITIVIDPAQGGAYQIRCTAININTAIGVLTRAAKWLDDNATAITEKWRAEHPEDQSVPAPPDAGTARHNVT
jgi:hypothetical protein